MPVHGSFRMKNCQYARSPKPEKRKYKYLSEVDYWPLTLPLCSLVLPLVIDVFFIASHQLAYSILLASLTHSFSARPISRKIQHTFDTRMRRWLTFHVKMSGAPWSLNHWVSSDHATLTQFGGTMAYILLNSSEDSGNGFV